MSVFFPRDVKILARIEHNGPIEQAEVVTNAQQFLCWFLQLFGIENFSNTTLSVSEFPADNCRNILHHGRLTEHFPLRFPV